MPAGEKMEALKCRNYYSLKINFSLRYWLACAEGKG